ncbi:MAG TPA: DNRLRE domain-containing protein, partial [Saprospiraceae bacterium]|nr:DNRLRE domain-containing protein [Saprospiraceae bacterium]
MKSIPLFICLFSSLLVWSQTTIVLQPGPADGKDAKIFNIGANINYGDDPDFVASTWTYSEEPGTMRSLIQFDISEIPFNAGIVDARLDLYYNYLSSSPGQSGHNAAFLRRIKQEWDEATVDWVSQPQYFTQNQVYIPESTSSNQDYIGINVAPLIRDMITDPAHSYGFMFMSEMEAVLCSMKFFSSDGAIPEKRPRLTITYITDPVECMTFQPGSEGKDAKLYDLEPEANFGDDEDLISAAWTFGGNPGILRSLVEFNISALPNNISVLNASLSLYYNSTSSSPGQSGVNQALLQRITAPWTENTVSWGTQPSTTDLHQVTLPVSTSTDEDYENIDVTDLIRDQLSDPDNSHGWMLRQATEEVVRSMKFASSDYSNAAKHPKLEICYSIGTEVKDINTLPLLISPNPFSDQLTIRGIQGDYALTVQDLQGE